MSPLDAADAAVVGIAISEVSKVSLVADWEGSGSGINGSQASLP